MASDTGPRAHPAGGVHHFVPVQCCGGLVAAVGVVLATGLGFVATLPGSPLAREGPTWLIWLLRIAPLPAIGLLWAVVSEAEFKVRTDSGAIAFRGLLGQVTRIPWHDVYDFFVNCGRGPEEVAESGGSLVGGAQSNDPHPPLHDYRPDYVLMTEQGVFVFNDTVAGLGLLTSQVLAHALPTAPTRWEEASWIRCPSCGERFAISLWPLNGTDEPLAPFVCPTCSASLNAMLDRATKGFVVQLRGKDRQRFVWRPPVATAEEPEQAQLSGAESPGADQPPQESRDEIK